MTFPSALQTPPAEPVPGEERKIDPDRFEHIARTIFAPVYPLIARQIIEETGITAGFCLDVGCGGGHLGMAVARLGDFAMGFLDPSQSMLRIAAQNMTEAGLVHRSRILEGSAEAIPLPDQSVDLAISRGSVFFWSDQKSAFREIARVLKPRGMAYIGGGFGSSDVREQIIQKMNEQDRGKERPFHKKISERLGPHAADRFRETLKAAGIKDFTLSQSRGRGLWITIRKGSACHDTM